MFSTFPASPATSYPPQRSLNKDISLCYTQKDVIYSTFRPGKTLARSTHFSPANFVNAFVAFPVMKCTPNSSPLRPLRPVHITSVRFSKNPIFDPHLPFAMITFTSLPIQLRRMPSHPFTLQTISRTLPPPSLLHASSAAVKPPHSPNPLLHSIKPSSNEVI